MIPIFSIGDKSGYRAGQGRVVTVRRQSCDTLGVQWHSIPSHQLWEGCIAVKQRKIETTGSPHTNIIDITAEIESGSVAKDDLVTFAALQFPRAWHHFKRKRRWVGVKSSTRNGRRDPKCHSARCHRTVRGTPTEGAFCAWMAADEAVGCMRAFLTMWWSSRRLVCRVRPEPGLRVNCISQIHWSQHLLTTQSERPN
ncbi:uncharacterized protein TNCV_853201 [Trichonephila clavipes]|nr:uncharacterized protein TNCV_853201 [Trichonephila clavipes]